MQILFFVDYSPIHIVATFLIQHRRLDIIVVPYDEYACALMYFTGSAHFNRSMRNLAGKMNMSLSEHSLNEKVVRVVSSLKMSTVCIQFPSIYLSLTFTMFLKQRREKVNKGVPLPTPTEESVFKHLGLKYRPPEERDHWSLMRAPWICILMSVIESPMASMQMLFSVVSSGEVCNITDCELCLKQHSR